MHSWEPLKNRYLWGVTPTAEPIPTGTVVGDRYQVIAPNIWVDHRPQLLPEVKEVPEGEVLAYLQLYPYRLHIPEVHAIVSLDNTAEATNVLLLDNVPIDRYGSLMPSIIEAWADAPSSQKVDWLWQILQLWEALAPLKVTSSLAIADNLRVDSGRVRLLQLYQPTSELGNFGWQKLGETWQDWFAQIPSPINSDLDRIYRQIQLKNASLAAIKAELNQLLLWQTQENSFLVRVVGATDIGTKRQENEDCYYPQPLDLDSDRFLSHHLAIVCDGVGGHDAGEVASNLAVASLKLQWRALIKEIAKEREIITPYIVTELLKASVRVANNLIVARNDEQQRDLRQRMATTLVMALHLPQSIFPNNGSANELYIVHVGDSRAYWLSRQGIVQLTVDDNVMNETVSAGENFLAQAIHRQDATVLTQALGIQPGELLEPRVSRFIVAEDGLLLLCSDGLSDNQLLELHWGESAQQILSGTIPLDRAVASLIKTANRYNGHDNISVVLTHFSRGKERIADSMPAVAQKPIESPLPSSRVNDRRNWIIAFVIAGFAIAGTVILALAMLSNRIPQPQPSNGSSSVDSSMR
jgi:protein phosphatase